VADPTPQTWSLRASHSDAAISRAGDGAWTLGRDGENDLTIAASGVSRQHAQIIASHGVVTIQDLNSANGTSIERGHDLITADPATPLQNGDIIRLGPARLTFSLGDPAQNDPTGGQPWGDGIHIATLAAGFSHFAVGFFIWALPAVLATDIAATHGLSAIEAKILPATAILVGAGARLGFGFATDARGPLASGTTALAVGLAALVLLATLGGESVIVVWIGVAILGVGLASLPVSLPLVSRRTPPDKRGLALGIMASGSVGIVLAALAGPALADALSWQDVFALALIPATLGLGVFVYGARGAWAPPPPGAWRPMAASRPIRTVAFLFGVTFGVFAGLYTVLPAVLQAENFDLTSSQAALVVAMGALAGAVSRVLGGNLADRFGSNTVLLWVMLGTTGLLLAAGNVPLGLALAAFIATMALFDAGTSAVMKLAAQSFGSTVGAGVGIISAAGGLLGFAVSLLASSLFESTDSSPLTFGVLALLPAAAFLGLLRQRRGAQPAPAAPAVARLERLDSYGAVAEIAPIGARLSLGRNPDNRLWLQGDPFASRRHAEILPQAGRSILRDLHSTNGTTIWRDRRWIRVAEEPLIDKDVVVVGGNVLRYREAETNA